MTYEGTRTYAPRPRPRERTPAQRREQKARRRRRYREPTRAEIRRRRQRNLMCLYAVLSVEIISAVLTSPVLAVKRQVVTGLGTLSPAEAVAVLHAARLTPGSNLLRVPVGGITHRIDALPFVRSVSIGRHLPPGLSVAVHPRIAVINAIINGVGYEVDRTGVPIRMTTPEHAAHLTPVVIESPQTVKLGSPLHNGMVTIAMDLLPKLQEATPVQVAKIEVDQTDSICLNMVDGLRILLGEAEDLDVKVSEIHRIYKYEPTAANRLATVNLTSPAEPACTLKNPPANGATGVSVGSTNSGVPTPTAPSDSKANSAVESD